MVAVLFPCHIPPIATADNAPRCNKRAHIQHIQRRRIVFLTKQHIHHECVLYVCMNRIYIYAGHSHVTCASLCNARSRTMFLFCFVLFFFAFLVCGQTRCSMVLAYRFCWTPIPHVFIGGAWPKEWGNGSFWLRTMCSSAFTVHTWYSNTHIFLFSFGWLWLLANNNNNQKNRRLKAIVVYLCKVRWLM